MCMGMLTYTGCVYVWGKSQKTHMRGAYTYMGNTIVQSIDYTIDCTIVCEKVMRMWYGGLSFVTPHLGDGYASMAD
jgi:hypothetical protein